VVGNLVDSFGAIHTSADSLPGFDVENNKENAAPPEINQVGAQSQGQDLGRDVHLTVRALIPKNNGGLVGDAYHQAPPRDTVVVEVRRGSEREVAKSGVEGEVLGRVVIVNTIMNPPRDEYKVEQYFEQL
jgi:hypothetical protein